MTPRLHTPHAPSRRGVGTRSRAIAADGPSANGAPHSPHEQRDRGEAEQGQAQSEPEFQAGAAGPRGPAGRLLSRRGPPRGHAAVDVALPGDPKRRSLRYVLVVVEEEPGVVAADEDGRVAAARAEAVVVDPDVGGDRRGARDLELRDGDGGDGPPGP